MTAKRFFILKDDEEEDTLPVIRDRIFKIDDIYGHYKYDDIEQICLFLNEQNNEIEMLKSKLEDCEFAHRTEMAHHRVIEKNLKKENEQLKQHKENTAKEFQMLLNFIRSKGLTLSEYEQSKGDVE